MWQQTLASFAAGVSVGPACMLHCGLFQIGFLSAHADAQRRRRLVLAAAMLGGRLLAYLLLGVCIGLLAADGLPLLRPWVVTLALGLVMAAYAAAPDRKRRRSCACARLPTRLLGGALAIGFISGISPCPPLLASGLIALHSNGIAGSVLTFAAFFAGSSLCLLPLLLGWASIPTAWQTRSRAVGRCLAGLVALYAFTMAAHQLGTALPPPDHHPDPPPPGGLRQQAPAAEQPMTDRGEAASEPKAYVPPPAAIDTEPMYPKEKPTRRFTAALVERLNLSLHEAMFYTRLPQGEVRCELCPSRCVLQDGEQGLCRARANIDGQLRSLVYARPVAVHVDPIEKKPLFHVLPASRALSIATAGCNLGCVFCQNFEISQAAPEDVRRTKVLPRQLVEHAVKNGYEGIAYTYTEPTVFYEYMLDTARMAREHGIRNYWVTCGQINEEPLLELCKVLDAANVDLKGFSDDFYLEYCNASLFPVLDTLKTLRREGVFVEVTNLIIPDANDNPDMIRNMCRWLVAELGPDVPLHFSRFHPAYKLTRRPATPTSTLVQARKIALSEGLHYVYIGNVRVTGAGDTMCPTCGRRLIRRVGYLITENHVRNGCCGFCNTPIPGIWDGD